MSEQQERERPRICPNCSGVGCFPRSPIDLPNGGTIDSEWLRELNERMAAAAREPIPCPECEGTGRADHKRLKAREEAEAEAAAEAEAERVAAEAAAERAKIEAELDEKDPVRARWKELGLL